MSEDTSVAEEPAVTTDVNEPGGSSYDATPGEPAVTPETPMRPAYLKEDFWDAEKGEAKVEQMAHSINMLRNQNLKMAEEKQVPTDFQSYLENYNVPHRARPGEGEKEGAPLDRLGEISSDDPGIMAAAKAAKDAGLSQAQFDDFMQAALENFNELAPSPFNEEAELKKLGTNGENVVEINQNWINYLNQKGVINEHQADLMYGLGATAEGVQLIDLIRTTFANEKPIPYESSDMNTGAKTRDELRSLLGKKGPDGTPLYDAKTPDGRAWKEYVDAEYAKAAGGLV